MELKKVIELARGKEDFQNRIKIMISSTCDGNNSEFARVLNKRASHVHAMQNGDRKFTQDTLQDLGELGFDPRWILGFPDSQMWIAGNENQKTMMAEHINQGLTNIINSETNSGIIANTYNAESTADPSVLKAYIKKLEGKIKEKERQLEEQGKLVKSLEGQVELYALLVEKKKK